MSADLGSFNLYGDKAPQFGNSTADPYCTLPEWLVFPMRGYRLLADEAVLVMRSDRRSVQPYGLNGGLPGTPSWNIVNPEPDQKLLPVCPMSPTPLVGGDEFVHIQAGAGGHGDPLERNPLAVLEDVLDDLISRDYARDVFGVIFQDGIVDKDATVAKRKALQTCRTHLTTYVDLFHSEVGIASSDWNAHEAKAGPL